MRIFCPILSKQENHFVQLLFCFATTIPFVSVTNLCPATGFLIMVSARSNQSGTGPDISTLTTTAGTENNIYKKILSYLLSLFHPPKT